mgnify:CR=1 FL=1
MNIKIEVEKPYKFENDFQTYTVFYFLYFLL